MITRNDWKKLAFFTNPPFLYKCHLDLTTDEINNLKQGHQPLDMNDKWFSYCEEDILYIHRSWTGHLMYRAQLSDLGITQTDIAMDDFVNLSMENKIEVFYRVITFLSTTKAVDDCSKTKR